MAVNAVQSSHKWWSDLKQQSCESTEECWEYPQLNLKDEVFKENANKQEAII